jgi:hypothetical protein
MSANLLFPRHYRSDIPHLEKSVVVRDCKLPLYALKFTGFSYRNRVPSNGGILELTEAIYSIRRLPMVEKETLLYQ